MTQPDASPGIQRLRVHAIAWEAEGISSFELRDPAGGALAPFAAGAHIDIHVRPDCVRQYSLCNDPSERHRYVIAPQREDQGRGGSLAMHRDVRVGDLLDVAGPRNNFPLVASASRHLLLAGGIGVTPMIAMIAELEALGSPYTLYYCTRSPERTAFLDRLSARIADGRVVLCHDGGDPSRGLDLATLLREPTPGTHVYYCGPVGFMRAAAGASAHWPPGTVHFEYFTAPAADPAREPDRAFTVRLARSGMDLEVPAQRSIVDVLREHEVFIETSCENGVCGTCLTRYTEGEPEHRDYVLDEADRREFVLVCCARSRTPVLTLDL